MVTKTFKTRIDELSPIEKKRICQMACRSDVVRCCEYVDNYVDCITFWEYVNENERKISK